VLAVGDMGFQKKCHDKIHKLHKEGRTIILVTHSPQEIKNNCNRCIVIDHGRKVYDGPTKEGADVYIKSMT
jgi:ABC-2 type transport system ATP-binding protein